MSQGEGRRVRLGVHVFEEPTPVLVSRAHLKVELFQRCKNGRNGETLTTGTLRKLSARERARQSLVGHRGTSVHLSRTNKRSEGTLHFY